MQDLIQALMALFTPSCLFYLFFGALAGVVLGAIPGLSGGTGLVIMLPLTFHMEAELAVATLVGIYIGGVSGGYIGSILLGIPGTTNSIATVFDGYEMTKKGEAVRALSAATTANFLGTAPSVLIALFASSWISAWAVQLGPWEYCSLMICALTLVITLSKGNLAKGMIAMGLGLLISCVGYAPICGTQRFTFGSYYLYGGFSFISIMMGIFAGATILLEYARNSKSAQGDIIKVTRFKLPVSDFVANKVNVIRSWIIGLVIGFLPGMGGTLANMVAYAQAKSSSKHPEEFGTGCVDGVIAPEVANNASVGGAIIPMVSLGIPGDGATALLMAALTLQGVQPGPLFSTNNPVLFNIIFFSAALAAIFVFIAEIIGMPVFPALLKIPYHFLYPAILVLVFAGAFMASNNMFDVFVMLGAILLGVILQYFRIPSAPLILTVVLGNNIETYLRRGCNMDANGWRSFFLRPISLTLIIIAVLSLLWSLFGEKIKLKFQACRTSDGS
ncbi:Tat pathway signal protein [Clostridium sp. MCC353]|uniref:tripartite tricarboxylate transporter permease n=1 Tax=Clostridium sp. MCC353 TaxID=2592646 RepID=UPI001C00E80E|nr:tripartite tricarboxylate transporter permease [Clostridium sp. MCC353]MBT9778718.1 Tat pathway signal protein [Clostridium sp. MCC353]